MKLEKKQRFNWLESLLHALMFIVLFGVLGMAIWLGIVLVPFLAIPDIPIQIKVSLIMVVIVAVISIILTILGLVRAIRERMV